MHYDAIQMFVRLLNGYVEENKELHIKREINAEYEH